MKTIARTIAVAGVLGLGGGLAMAAQERSPDAQAIEALSRAGSDLSRLHDIEFSLRFPSQKSAEKAELQLIGFAFTTKIAPGATADQWLLRGTKKMYPLESDLSGLRDKLNAIAAEGKGTYEGWKAKAVAAGSP